MQQKFRVPLLTVSQLFLWLALDIIAAQPSCNPPCVAGQELCQQVFNTNGQYACVAIVSPSTRATPPPTATSTSMSSPVPAGCRSCFDGQTCEQVLNSNQYHCVDNSTKSATSPTTPALASPAASIDVPAGCQGCSQAQICEQVLNSNQYHCVNNSTKTATPPTPLATPSKTPVPAGCQACTPNQLCRQVFNSDQYHCVDNSTVVQLLHHPTAALLSTALLARQHVQMPRPASKFSTASNMLASPKRVRCLLQQCLHQWLLLLL